MIRSTLLALTWATLIAALSGALLLTATDGAVADAESVRGALASLEALVEPETAAEPAPTEPAQAAPTPGYDLGR